MFSVDPTGEGGGGGSAGGMAKEAIRFVNRLWDVVVAITSIPKMIYK